MESNHADGWLGLSHYQTCWDWGVFWAPEWHWRRS